MCGMQKIVKVIEIGNTERTGDKYIYNVKMLTAEA